jgi:hypothetical protein
VKLTYEEVEYTARVPESDNFRRIMQMHDGSQLWRVAVKCDDKHICSSGELVFAWGGTLQDAKRNLLLSIVARRDLHTETAHAFSKAIRLVNEGVE